MESPFNRSDATDRSSGLPTTFFSGFPERMAEIDDQPGDGMCTVFVFILKFHLKISFLSSLSTYGQTVAILLASHLQAG